MDSVLQKLCKTILLICCLILTPTLAKADIQTIYRADNEIWGAAGGSLFKYKEPSIGPNLPDSENGWLPSIAVGISSMTAQNWYLALETSLAYGNADYDGAFLFSPTTPLKGTTTETISNSDIKFGKGFALGSDILLTPYSQIGFRYWDRNLGGGQVEDYRNFAVLGGLMLQVSPMDRLTLTAYGAGGTTFAAQAKSDPDTFNLGDAGTYNLGGKVGYNVTRKTEFFTSFDYNYLHYIQSAVASDGFYEPTSHTEETTIRMGVAYHFN